MDEEENFPELLTKIYYLLFLTYNPKCLITTFAKKKDSIKLPLYFVKKSFKSLQQATIVLHDILNVCYSCKSYQKQLHNLNSKIFSNEYNKDTFSYQN